MGAAKKIKMILVDREMTLKSFAESTGKSYQVLLNMLSRDTMKYSTVEEFADQLDCDVVFRDRKTGKLY